MGDRFPRYPAAAVQMAAVWMDREAALSSYPVWDEIGYHGRPDVFRVLINREPYTEALGEWEPPREGERK